MRRIKARKKTNVLKKIKILIVLLISIIAAVFFFKSPFFKISTIELNLLNVMCTDDKGIKEGLNLLGSSIFLTDKNKISRNLKDNYICIKGINLVKNYPNKLKIEVIGKEALAQLISVDRKEASVAVLIEDLATPSANMEDVGLIDEEGVIFAKGQKDAISKIYVFNDKESTGSKLAGDYLTNALDILEFLQEFKVSYLRIYIIDNFLIVQTTPKIIFRLDADTKLQLASLQLILQKAKIDESRLEFIDLRFDKPIVRIAPKKN